jgi:regulator of protease activity HflC (stomatin/prohibitin superfamily)
VGIKVNRVELKNILPPREIQDAMEKQMKAERERRESILRAEARKETSIREAEGEAEAILKVQQATAEGLKMLNASNPTNAVIAIKSLEAFEKAADGKATKITIPSQIQGLAGLATTIAELMDRKEVE